MKTKVISNYIQFKWKEIQQFKSTAINHIGKSRLAYIYILKIVFESKMDWINSWA